MEFRELLNTVVLVVVLQTGLGVVLYGLTRRAPGVNLFSVGLSIVFLVAVSSAIGGVLYWLVRRYTRERAIRTAMMTMSDGEQKVLREVMRREKIRQDDLRRELGFSKSKLSALLNNLEDKRAIKKTRYKRTNHLKPVYSEASFIRIIVSSKLNKVRSSYIKLFVTASTSTISFELFEYSLSSANRIREIVFLSSEGFKSISWSRNSFKFRNIVIFKHQYFLNLRW